MSDFAWLMACLSLIVVSVFGYLAWAEYLDYKESTTDMVAMIKQFIVFTLGVAYPFIVFWASGGEFVRSDAFGSLFVISPAMGLIFLMFYNIHRS